MDATQQQNHMQYQPQPQPQPQFVQPGQLGAYVQSAPRVVAVEKSWHAAKIVLGSIAIAFAVVLLGVGAGIDATIVHLFHYNGPVVVDLGSAPLVCRFGLFFFVVA